jgi:hypothetical protein
MGIVIENRFYRHTTGRTASIYGSLPWRNEAEKAGWTLVSEGYTIEHPDGTVGLGRKPFATKEEAQAWVAAHPNFPGMRQD